MYPPLSALIKWVIRLIIFVLFPQFGMLFLCSCQSSSTTTISFVSSPLFISSEMSNEARLG